eukprot:UN33271
MEANRVIVHGGASSDSLLEKGDKNFLTYTVASQYFLPAMEELQKAGVSSVCVISIDSSFPLSVASGALEHAENLGLEFHADILSHQSGDVDTIRSHLETCWSGGYDAVLASTNTLVDSKHYIEQSEDLGYFPGAFVITVYGASPELTNAVGASAIHVIGPTQWSEHLPSEDMDDIFGTAADYASIYYDSEHHIDNAPPSYQTAGASAAVLSIYYGIMEADEANPGSEITDTRLGDALHSMNRMSFWGKLQWESNGSTDKPMYATQIMVN